MSYHLVEIPKGVYGNASKITEEYKEFIDAYRQGCSIMELVELSDLLGAIEAYVLKFGMSLDDLKQFSDVTKRAFESGHRQNRDGNEATGT